MNGIKYRKVPIVVEQPQKYVIYIQSGHYSNK